MLSISIQHKYQLLKFLILIRLNSQESINLKIGNFKKSNKSLF